MLPTTTGLLLCPTRWDVAGEQGLYGGCPPRESVVSPMAFYGFPITVVGGLLLPTTKQYSSSGFAGNVDFPMVLPWCLMDPMVRAGEEVR